MDIRITVAPLTGNLSNLDMTLQKDRYFFKVGLVLSQKEVAQFQNLTDVLKWVT
jgi:hypothetical protein